MKQTALMLNGIMSHKGNILINILAMLVWLFLSNYPYLLVHTFVLHQRMLYRKNMLCRRPTYDITSIFFGYTEIPMTNEDCNV